MVGIKSKAKIYDLIMEYPDIQGIMEELGFSDITKPGMLQSAGRVMTLEKGAKMKGMPWKIVENKFMEYGYEITKED